jgi:hypothetical protein
MLCPPLTPLNRRPNVPDLPDPHRARSPAQRVRSSARGNEVGTAPNEDVQPPFGAVSKQTFRRRFRSTDSGGKET